MEYIFPEIEIPSPAPATHIKNKHARTSTTYHINNNNRSAHQERSKEKKQQPTLHLTRNEAATPFKATLTIKHIFFFQWPPQSHWIET